MPDTGRRLAHPASCVASPMISMCKKSTEPGVGAIRNDTDALGHTPNGIVVTQFRSSWTRRLGVIAATASNNLASKAGRGCGDAFRRDIA
ncbi:hypothetical protein [Sphingopyxis chilensis]